MIRSTPVPITTPTAAFPPGFAWGAASAAFQIEGAAAVDGRKESVWDMYCRVPGAVVDGVGPDPACDHYRRSAEDVALMREIGLKAYRFSLSWPRILPNGTGAVNEAGLAFYDRLVDQLLAAGIEPWVTLFHWDYPIELFYRGGWLNPDSPRWFADYASLVARRLGDRVKRFMTFNEPQNVANLGHGSGSHAPGLKLPRREVVRVIHHILLAHGLGARALRAAAPGPIQVGHAHSGWVNMPLDAASAADRAACEANMFGCGKWHPQKYSWWNDPLVLGRYPEDGLATLGADGPPIAPGDLETIKAPLDFLGINYYGGTPIRAGAQGQPEDVAYPDDMPLVHPRRPIAPAGLYWGPRLIHSRYRLPVVVTENGFSGLDWVGHEGKVEDPGRSEWIRQHLRHIRQAISDGAEVGGYFYWSATDNLEWAEGYRQRFGLIHVDFATQQRTLKESGRFYGKVIAARGAGL